MQKKIYTLNIGGTNCYIIQGAELFLVDSGESGSLSVFLKKLKHLRINFQKIGYAIVTHSHWDHIGFIGEIKTMTNCKIFAHELEKQYLEKGIVFDPPAFTLWGKLLKSLTHFFYLQNISIAKTEVDINITSPVMDLQPYGLEGRIIHTPGHSPGSISVLLNSGEAFVGDLAVNRFPQSFYPGLSPFGENLNQIKESWNILLNEGAKTIFPAHGSSFPIDQIVRHIRM